MDKSLHHRPSDGPVLTPPYYPSDPLPPDVAIKCDYSAMGEKWKLCNAADNRACWLQGPVNEELGIDTDYERIWPKDITRK